MSESAMRELGRVCQRASWRLGGKGGAPLTTTQFRETLLPHLTQPNFHLKSIHKILALTRHQLGEVPR